MSHRNHLKIHAAHLDLDLRGEAEYVERAYAAIRPVLMERYRESLLAPGAIRETSELESIPRPAKAVKRAEPEPKIVNVVMCGEVYNKVFISERDRFDEGLLGRALSFDGLRRIYVNRSQESSFSKDFKFEKVLWRELTAAGRQAVKKG